MKITWLLACVILIFSCKNQSKEAQNSTADTATIGDTVAKTNSSKSSNNSLQSAGNMVKPHTTLDSLQGAWISNIDNSDRVSIVGRQYIETYEGENAISKNNIFFADSCISELLSYEDRSRLDSTRENGRYMVLSDVNVTSVNLCYQIDYIDNKHLVLIYRNKTLDFHKE